MHVKVPYTLLLLFLTELKKKKIQKKKLVTNQNGNVRMIPTSADMAILNKNWIFILTN